MKLKQIIEKIKNLPAVSVNHTSSDDDRWHIPERYDQEQGTVSNTLYGSYVRISDITKLIDELEAAQ